LKGTHHAKAGSFEICVATKYSASYTGYVSLASFNGTRVVLPSFHWMRTSHPTVVSLRRLVPIDVITKPSFWLLKLVPVRPMINNFCKHDVPVPIWIKSSE
jgi:hypothetical protein